MKLLNARNEGPHHGIWWIAGQPENQVTGTLSRDEDEWQLLVHGALANERSWSQGLSTTPGSIIHGMSGNEVYTLYQAYYRGGTAMPIARGALEDEPSTGTDRGRWQQWWGLNLLRGEAVEQETTFTSASFELTGLNAWWPESALSSSMDFNDYKSPPPKIAYWNGATVGLRMNVGGAFGRRTRHMDETVSFYVDRAEGFTFDWLRSQVITPLQALLGAYQHRKIEYFCCVLNIEDDARGHPRRVYVDPSVIEDDDHKSPYGQYGTLDVSSIDFSEFIPRWLDLARSSPIATASCLEPYGVGPLQTRVLTAINAAETLHRTLHNEQPDLSLAEEVNDILKKAGYSARKRSPIRHSVKLSSQQSLEKRLRQLAEELGSEFHSWLFDGRMADWALVSATIRNALTHGFPTEHHIESDFEAQIGVERSITAVTRLRMLCEAGLPNDWSLVQIALKDEHYKSLLHQSVADWATLAQKIRATYKN